MKPHSSRSVFSLSRRSPHLGGRAEAGIIVIITLIALVVLLLSSIALVRSFTNANIVAGSVAIKRDMVNQAQRGLSLATAAFTNPELASAAERVTAVPDLNYSPCMLPSDAYGIPIIIQDTDANFVGTTDLDGSHDPACSSSAIANATHDIIDPITQVAVRYVIDRLCVTTASPNATACIVSTGTLPGGTQYVARPAGAAVPVYRITVRVKTGNLSSYVQSTVSS